MFSYHVVAAVPYPGLAAKGSGPLAFYGAFGTQAEAIDEMHLAACTFDILYGQFTAHVEEISDAGSRIIARCDS